MKAIIFDDRENSTRSLNRLNNDRPATQRRYFKIRLFHEFIFQKVAALLKNQCSELELVKTFIYTGAYNPKVLNNIKKSCGSKIKEMNELIKKEDLLLAKVMKIDGHTAIKEEVIRHVNSIKEIFQNIKQTNIKAIEQQQRNAEGQRNFFDYIKNKVPFTELRTTQLVTRGGFVRQKGVDARFSTDLLQLAQSNAFDVAILLTGDADLKETIKLIRNNYGKLVFLVACFSNIPEEQKHNTISEELLEECDCFINVNNLPEEDVFKISKPKNI